MNLESAQEFENDAIDQIPDERIRMIMQCVRDTADRITAMDAESGGTALMSLVATLCGRCPDPVGALDFLTAGVREKLLLGQSQPQGHG